MTFASLRQVGAPVYAPEELPGRTLSTYAAPAPQISHSEITVFETQSTIHSTTHPVTEMAAASVSHPSETTEPANETSTEPTIAAETQSTAGEPAPVQPQLQPATQTPDQPTAQPAQPIDPVRLPTPLTAQERNDLACMADSECYPDNIEGMMAVIETAVNRVGNPRFTGQKTVRDVLFAEGQYARASEFASMTPSETALEAVRRVCDNGESVIGTQAVFHAQKGTPAHIICPGIVLVCEQGGNEFWRLGY